MIHESISSLNTNLLAELTGRAIEAYPASAASIRKAHTMVLGGAVTLSAHEAFVESATTPGTYYRVAGQACSCPATTPLCCHRFAVALLRRYQAEESLPQPAPPARPKRYYAWLLGANELAVQAEAEATPGRYTLYYRDAVWAYNIPGDMLTLLGEVELSDLQRQADGDLVAKACGR